MDFSKGIISKLLSTGAALLIFFAVSALYFTPQFRGEALPQHDVMQYQGMTKDINDMRTATGEDPQWTGGMFGGMPAYLINVAYPAQLVKHTAGKVVKVIDTPAGFLFFAMTAMWVMLLIFGVNPWVGIVAALAYGLSTYFLLIISAGHITKMWALVYAPLMMGGAWMTLRSNIWLGGALTALAASLEIGANHPQITYYFLMAMGALWLSDGITSLREKRLPDFARRTGILIAAGLLSVGSNFSPLWYTAQHTKDTMRGGSELTSTTETSQTGLALDYATAWSYGRLETLNLLVPDFMGRDSGQTFSSDGEVAAVVNDYGLRGAAQQLPAYWGTQPYTGGPTYLGAVAIFLAALGITLLRGRNKWWIIGISVLMVLFAWGHNLMWFTELAFKYLPGYNKFRTVSMTLVVVQWTVPLLGALGLMQLWKQEISKQKLLRGLAWAAGITGGLCLILAVAGSSLFDFGQADSEAMLTDQFRHILEANNMQEQIRQGLDVEMAQATAAAMASERASMMSADAWRSLLFILFAAGSVAFFALRKINKYILTGILGILILADLVPVDQRFLSSENFTSPRHQQITATAADKDILQDKTLGYRVFNLTVSPFNDATTSYFHRSVGGYHGAKMARYQDMIDRYLANADEQILDLLNTRYLILPNANGEPQASLRTTANGPAWFADSVAYAATPQQEIDLVGKVNTKTTAVVREGTQIGQLGAGTIALTEYRPNHLVYEYTSPEGGLVVFSEIFYDKGWKAYIDGAEAAYFQVDYILRAMEAPAGTHSIEWRFRAPGWTISEGITLTSSLIILLGSFAALVYYFWKNRHSEKLSKKEI